jgi:hypothetical protein
MHSVAYALAVAVLAIVVVPSRLVAQEPARNALYVELFGSGGLSSLNFERRAGAARLRAGYANWSSDDEFGAGTTRYSTYPLTVSHLKGKGNHHLESGGGVTLGSRRFSSSFGDSERSRFVTLTGLIGYRYQKPGAGFVFRALFTPMYGLGDEDTAYPDPGFFPSVGLSFGASF